ncbi:unnamed protein product [Ophioblennius macclurei]
MSASVKNNKRGRGSDTSEGSRFYGLRNQGSTCYLNSVLQVLFMSPEFREAVKRHAKKNQDTDHIDRQLSELFDQLRNHIGETIQITNKLGIQSVNKQSDAAKHFEKIMALTSSEASQIFRGCLVHTTECLHCHTKTSEDGPFWHLPLSLEESSTEDYSVTEGIVEFFKTSLLDGENQLYCDDCDNKQDALIKCEMTEHPDILMLLLKRFEFNYSYRSYTKNHCAVAVPLTLRIPQDQIYELYAFVEHFGCLKSGHYTATIQSQDDKGAKWYNFNDSHVRQIDHKHSKEDNRKNIPTDPSSPYLLFYRKKNDVHPCERNDHSQDTANRDGIKPAVEVDDTAADDSVHRNEEPPAKRRVSDKSHSAGGLSDNFNTQVQDSGVSVEQSGPSHQTAEGGGDGKQENVKQETDEREMVRDEGGEMKAARNEEKRVKQVEGGVKEAKHVEAKVIVESRSDDDAEQHEIAKRNTTTKGVGGEEEMVKTKGKTKASKVAPSGNKLEKSGQVTGSEDIHTLTPGNSFTERNESQKQKKAPIHLGQTKQKKSGGRGGSSV